MKRMISALLTLIMVISLLSTMVLAVDTEKTTVTVQDASGFATQAVDVIISVNDAEGLSGATLKIKYDKGLELVSVSNGDFFANIADSAIYSKDTSGVEGEYTYVGIDDGEDSKKVMGNLLSMTFKISKDAQAGDTYTVEVDKNLSTITTGVDSKCDFDVIKGTVTVVENTGCAAHSYEETTVSESSYFTNGYSYKKCTVCGAMETNVVPATEINAFDFLGMSMNYTGNPSGIAPMFKVNGEALRAVKTANPDCKVDAGIVVYKDGKLYDEEIFFGEGATYKLVNGVLFIKITDVSVYDKFTFKAYVKITNQDTQTERIAYTTATLRGNEEISICDVAKCLDLTAFSRENKKYIEDVLNGFAK